MSGIGLEGLYKLEMIYAIHLILKYFDYTNNFQLSKKTFKIA